MKDLIDEPSERDNVSFMQFISSPYVFVHIFLNIVSIESNVLLIIY
jgi:hypothetical protein